MSHYGFISIYPPEVEPPLPAIEVVQNVSDDLGLSQTVNRVGSVWVRSIENDGILEQSFSEYYGEVLTSNLVLSSTSSSVCLRVVSATAVISLTQDSTVAGGRITTGGGSGDTNNTFAITYDSAGPSATQGQVVYVDDADGEAKLASKDAVAEVAGFLTEDVLAGAATRIQTEGEIDIADWSGLAGTATLTPGATYYLHTGGEIRVTPPATGVIVVVGRAITTTKFDVEINLPWE